jgi:hypothetical protein
MIRKGLTILTAAVSVCGLAMLTAPAFAGTLDWSGTVDQGATIRLTDKHVEIRANMKGVRDEHERIIGRLPHHATTVQLADARGRGTIRIVEQPSEANNFTAVIHIRDNAAGPGHYHFILNWGRNANGM